MAEQYGWRNFWWFYVALCAFTAICCIFLFPETKYHRPTRYVSEEEPPVSHSKERVIIELTNAMISHSQGLGFENNTRPTPNIFATVPQTPKDIFLGRGKPSKQQWKLWQPYEGNLVKEFILPIYLHIYPIVELAAFNVSFSASTFLALNLTQSQVFAAPPYNFSSQTIGFFNFATLIGTIVGLLTAGPLSDWIAAKLTVHNHGIREPEMRLLAAIPYVIVMIIGNVVVAVGYQKFWDWRVSCFNSGLYTLPHLTDTESDHSNDRLYIWWSSSRRTSLHIFNICS